MEMNFCRRCGKPLSKVSDNAYTCSSGHTLYTNPLPSVGIFFITPNLDVILSVRGLEPHKGMLDAFGGLVDYGDESLEAAANRELQEELSLTPDEYEPLVYLTSLATPYEYKSETFHLISSLYYSRLKTDRSLTPSDDVAAIQKVGLHEVDMNQLHAEDIRLGIKALQTKFPKEEN